MEVINITPFEGEMVEIECEEGVRYYRRFHKDGWEYLIGESWEPIFYPEKLEKVYKDATT